MESFGKEWADHEQRMYEDAGGDGQAQAQAQAQAQVQAQAQAHHHHQQQQQQYMQMLIDSPETNERTQQLALLWRVIVPEMSRLLVRIHADSGRWYMQVGQTALAVRSLSRAMQVADMVASEEMGNLSDAFSKGHLQVFLEDVRRAGVDLLRCTGKDAVEICDRA